MRSLWMVLATLTLLFWGTVFGHDPNRAVSPSSAPAQSSSGKSGGVSGQGKMKFRVLLTGDQLPSQAQRVLEKAHGGFGIDRRPGQGETYFALAGAGILKISSDLKQVELLKSPVELKDENLHNTTFWESPEGEAFLTFPANQAGKVFTTTLEGKLVHVLDSPSGEEPFEQDQISQYFKDGGRFTPTDVDWLDDLFYIATGYSELDFVLTARILNKSPFQVFWEKMAFGGKGEGKGQLGTGHGVTISPDESRVDVADRPNSEIDRFSPAGEYLSTLALPSGSFPCDIDYQDDYAVVACLHGPDRDKGAPIYILEKERVISTIMPKEDLGLQNFQHVHNAVLRKHANRYYVIAQAWNPGDFVILEQIR